MAFREYSTRLQMIADGWKFPPQPEIASCRDCGKKVEWVRSRRGRNIPLDLGTTRVHFGTCSGKTNQIGTSSTESEEPPEPGVAPPGELADVIAELADAVRQLTAAIRESRR